MEKQIYTIMLIICFSSLLILQSKSQQTHISLTKKVTRLHFYLQDVIGGERPTVWGVAECNLTAALPSEFGKFVVLDNLVTAGPGLDSGEVGRLQGTVARADLREKAIAMVLNLVFTAGDYAGSTLSILGRNPLGAEAREVPIVAGTGKFRMATGYIITSTYFSDPARVRIVYEYSAVVYHHVESDEFSSQR